MMETLKNKLYTYEDWMDGNFDDKKIQAYAGGYIISDGKYGIPETENKKIFKAKKKAFDWAVEIEVSNMKDRALRKIGDIKNPKRWLELEIKRIETFIESNLDLEMGYLNGERDLRKQFIPAHKYKRIKDCYEGFHKHGKAIVVLAEVNEGEKERSKMQKMYVYKEYLPFLKDLEPSINTQLECDLPDSLKVAKQFYNKPNNKRKKYKVDDIQPIMEVTKEYILNKGIDDIYGHVSAICSENFPGDVKTQRNWIKFYGQRAGLKYNGE